jgi:hypothetical protein
VLLCGAVAGTAAFACLAPRVPPPREYLMVLATLAATGTPAGGLAALRDCALVAALITRLDELAAALENGAPPPDNPATTLDLPQHPRTVAAAQLLAAAMSGRSAAGARRPH